MKIIYKHSEECRKREVQEMRTDPEYRRLLEKHGCTLDIHNMEIFTMENVQEKKHQIQKAIAELERRERQQHRGDKQAQLNKTMRSILLEQMDVAEVYSPPGIVAMAQQMGLRGGWSLDLTTCDNNEHTRDLIVNV